MKIWEKSFFDHIIVSRKAVSSKIMYLYPFLFAKVVDMLKYQE